MHAHTTKIVSLARRESRAQWAIGDAILEVYGPPENKASLQDLAQIMEREGLTLYTKQYLERMRTISHRFPPDKRISQLPWSIHYESGTPEMLATIREVCRHERAKLDRSWLRNFTRRYKAALEREKQREAVEAMHKPSEAFGGKPFTVFVREASTAAITEEDNLKTDMARIISLLEAQTFCEQPTEIIKLLSKMEDIAINKELPEYILKEVSERLLMVINHATRLHSHLTTKPEKPVLKIVSGG